MRSIRYNPVSNASKTNRKRPRPKRRRPRVLLSMDGRSVRHSWLTVRLPAGLIVGLGIVFVLLCITIIASPELAAKLGALVSEWVALQRR